MWLMNPVVLVYLQVLRHPWLAHCVNWKSPRQRSPEGQKRYLFCQSSAMPRARCRCHISSTVSIQVQYLRQGKVDPLTALNNFCFLLKEPAE